MSILRARTNDIRGLPPGLDSVEKKEDGIRLQIGFEAMQSFIGSLALMTHTIREACHGVDVF